VTRGGASDGGTRWRELRALFDQVVELPEAERGAALARLCGQDRARADEVLALVRAAEQGDEFLVPPPLARPAEAGGARVGRFVLERVLGAGRAGTVHLARDARDGTALAVRVVPLVEDELDAVARLRGATRVLAALDHPGLARTLETGLCAWPSGSEGSAVYFASELVDGAALVSTSAAARPARASLELFLGACDALAQAHAAGALHGALSAANVVVDSRGRARVLDLGVRMVFPDPRDAPSVAGDRRALADLCLALLASAPEDEPWLAPARALAERAALPDGDAELPSVAALATALRREVAS
jgi:serine/threonine-protein kinase